MLWLSPETGSTCTSALLPAVLPQYLAEPLPTLRNRWDTWFLSAIDEGRPEMTDRPSAVRVAAIAGSVLLLLLLMVLALALLFGPLVQGGPHLG